MKFIIRKKVGLIFICSMLLGVIVVSCSTRINTSSRRFYQQMVTKYNVNFNGYESLNEGVVSIHSKHIDNYAEILSVFPFDTLSLGSVKEQLERAKDKAKKAIKKHSIRKKPSKNPIKYRTDPDYFTFYNQDEFNDQLYKSWMLLAEAQFYNGEFMRAVGSFDFISKKYESNPVISSNALIWKARCYTELEWYLESDLILNAVNQNGFPDECSNWYSKVYSDLLIKDRKYKLAIEPLKKTISTEKNRANKLRYIFILAQLYKDQKNNALAYSTFSDLIKKRPEIGMSINARIKRAELEGTEYPKIKKELTHLLHKHRNDIYSSRIFYALGGVGIAMNDTLFAENNYKESIVTEEKDDFYSGLSSLALGNIYNNKQEYREASNYFVPASKLFKESYRDYKYVKKQSETYAYFSSVYDAVLLQDSLNYLASMTEEDRNDVIDKLIEQEKKRLYRESEQDKDKVKNKEDIFDKPQDGAWYFYNEKIVAEGKTLFKKNWGNRGLQDGWRIQDAIVFNSEEVQSNELNDQINNIEESSSTFVDRSKFEKDIPLDEEAKEKARLNLDRNLLSLAYSYQFDLNDFQLAIETFKRYVAEFPESSQIGSVYYALYQLNDSVGDFNQAAYYRNILLDRYSNTRFGLILTDPNYLGKIAVLNKEESSDYSNIYSSFVNDNSSEVIYASNKFKDKYNDSSMRPQILYMQGISKGKMGNMKGFEDDLELIVSKYSESDIAPLSASVLNMFEQDSTLKDSLIILPQGSHKGLLDQKDSEIAALQATQKTLEWKPMREVLTEEDFTYNPSEKHYFAVWINDTSNIANNVLYETARLNFTKFIDEGYNLGKRHMKGNKDLIIVGSFSDNQDALKYGKIYNQDSVLPNIMKGYRYKILTISEKNLKVLSSSLNSDNYIWFYNKYYLGIVSDKPKKKTSPKLQTELIKSSLITEDLLDSINYLEAPPEALSKDILVENISEINDSLYYDDYEEKSELIIDNKYGGIYQIDNDSIDQYYAIACIEGNINVDSLQVALDSFIFTYNPNLKINLQVKKSNNFKLILIGPLGNKDSGLKFLYEVVKDEKIKATLQSCEYRNALISLNNANFLIKSGNLSLYSSYFKTLYLDQQ